jgi:hypothetical protein
MSLLGCPARTGSAAETANYGIAKRLFRSRIVFWGSNL